MCLERYIYIRARMNIGISTITHPFLHHTTLHTTAVQFPSHYQWYILIGKQWYQLPEFIQSSSSPLGCQLLLQYHYINPIATEFPYPTWLVSFLLPALTKLGLYVFSSFSMLQQFHRSFDLNLILKNHHERWIIKTGNRKHVGFYECVVFSLFH